MAKKLFIPGPVNVHPDVYQAMCAPMIGHRMKEYAELHGRVTKNLKKLLGTVSPVFLATASAFGSMEGAVRNLVKGRCANFCNGAFSDKWHDVTLRCGKEADAIKVPWGEPITAQLVDNTLSSGKYDSMTMIHNETSTGVMSPLAEIAKVMKKYPEVVFIVDTVSSISALPIPVDEYGIDCCIFGVQKALALPPGLSVFTASEKAIARARIVENRGYYFDFLEFLASDEKDNTPSTPCISLIYGLDCQLSRIFSEGVEARWSRHLQMAEQTRAWALKSGFELFAPEGARSVTLTCIKNSRGVDLAALKKRLSAREYAFDDGYGKIKGETFRIAHMGDLNPAELDRFLEVMDQELKG
jgi:aspartate aminotransferase-like enzyme